MSANDADSTDPELATNVISKVVLSPFVKVIVDKFADAVIIFLNAILAVVALDELTVLKTYDALAAFLIYDAVVELKAYDELRA